MVLLLHQSGTQQFCIEQMAQNGKSGTKIKRLFIYFFIIDFHCATATKTLVNFIHITLSKEITDPETHRHPRKNLPNKNRSAAQYFLYAAGWKQ